VPVYSWNYDKDRIVARLRAKATLKLCVKLLDEPLLIEDWIRHHGNIVGFANLIIADNGSTHPDTLEAYAKFGELATIFRFEGPHNDIHWHPRFDDLFEVIRESCRYFSFIDADERLVHINENKWAADPSIVSKICHNATGGIIPTTWLINTLNSLDTFSLLDTEFRPRLINNLRWGKPILPVNLVRVQGGIHNVQFNNFGFTKGLGVSLFLLHYTQFPERRIEVNRNKMISRGVIDKTVSARDIAQMSFGDHPDKDVMRFATEIRQMLQIISSGVDVSRDQTGDFLKLQPDGHIHYSNDHVQRTFTEYLSGGAALITQALDDGPDEGKLDTANSLFACAMDLRQQGQGIRAERLFRRGMALYPGFHDRYGAPAFRKELLRMLLAQAKWAKAAEVYPSSGNPGGSSWHYILVARAYSQIGDNENATKWWKLVLAQDPNHGEACDFLTTA
jgi:hypothetical protein